MKQCKRFFAFALASVMLVSQLPAAFAAGTDGSNGSGCTGTMECTLTEGHNEGCQKAAYDAALAQCGKAEGCTSTAHHTDCPVGIRAADQKTFDGMVTALPKPETIDPRNEEQVRSAYDQILAAADFAVEKGLYADRDTVTSLPAIAALLDAMYPKTTSAVATVNGVEYNDLQAAIDAAALGQTVTLLADVTINAVHDQPETCFHVDADDSIVIDLGGKTVTGAFFVESGGSATIHSGTIINESNVAGIESKGNMTVKDLKVYSDRHALRIDGGIVTIMSGHYEATNDAAEGTAEKPVKPTEHAVNISSGAKVYIQDGTFVGAPVTSGGAAVAIRGDQSTLTINGGTFKNPDGPFTLGLWGGIIEITDGYFYKAQLDTLNLGGVNAPSGSGKGDLKGIANGFFEEAPDVQLLADGKAAVLKNGWYEIGEADAKIVDLGNYYTLQEAITAATNGQTVQLLDNVTGDVTVGKNITLDLATWTLNSKISAGTPGVSFSIKGSSTGNDITLTGADQTGYAFNGWYTDNGFTTEVTSPISVTSDAVSYYSKWTLNPPTAVTVSADKTSMEKNNGTVVLTATSQHDLEDATFTYQWYKDGTVVSGATGATYTANNLQAETKYTCAVKAKHGSFTSAETTSNEVTISVTTPQGTITIAEDTLNAVVLDGTKTFAYTTNITDAANITVTSSKPEVATVSHSNGTVTVTIVGAGETEITVAYPGTEDFTAASDKLTLTVYKEAPLITANAVSGTYGDTISLTVNVALNPNTRAAGQDQVAFFYGNTKLGEAAVTYNDAKTSGIATLSYNTVDGKIPVGTGSKISVQYGGGLYLNAGTAELTVNLAARPLTITGMTAVNRPYNGTTTVALSGGTITGLLSGDAGNITLPTTGTVASANVGAGKAVTVAISGDLAAFYTLTLPSLTVDITPVQLTATYEGETITTNDTPALAVKVEGFVNGETAASLAAADYTAPTMPAAPTTVGTHSLTPRGGAATNYTFTYVPGNLVINQGTAQITPGNVVYFVEHYKATTSGYTLTEKETLRGEVGKTVSATPKVYTDYILNTARSVVSGTLKAVTHFPSDRDTLSPDILVLKLYYDVDYTIIKGAKQTITMGNTATFVSDADISTFVKVQVDARDVDPSNYSVLSGSTKVTLKSAYIKSLGAGIHSLSIVSKDGTATTTFTVKKAADSSPATGDITNTGLWYALAIVGLLGFVASVVGKKYLKK